MVSDLEPSAAEVTILAICGSLRRDSYNGMLIATAVALAPAGIRVTCCDGLREIPPFDEDEERRPPRSVVALADAVRLADALLIATPEYNSSLPGVLKNALDWLSRPLATSPLRFKNAVVIGASTSAFGAVWAQAETRKVLKAIGARVLDCELALSGAHERVDASGRLADRGPRTQLVAILEELAREARRDKVDVRAHERRSVVP